MGLPLGLKVDSVQKVVIPFLMTARPYFRWPGPSAPPIMGLSLSARSRSQRLLALRSILTICVLAHVMFTKRNGSLITSPPHVF